MRLWSVNPVYLDAKGLVANWREGLLARKVLLGKTIGYRNHPQLVRFKRQKDPISAIDIYLRFVADEGFRRGYNFDISKLGKPKSRIRIRVTDGQVRYEFSHLMNKLKTRDPDRYEMFNRLKKIKTNRIFIIVHGDKEPWEK